VCRGRTELEDPKDLRAEIGKFPNSTNERKKMSIQTLRKRIAVVAVSALTAGVLTVASTPVANAALDAQPAISAATTWPNVCSVASDNTSAVAKVGGIVQITPSQASAGDDTYVDFTGPASFSAIDSSGVTYNTSGQAIVTSDSDYVGVRVDGVGTIKVSFRNSSTGAQAYLVTITGVTSCANGTPSSAYSFAQIVDKDDTEAFGTRAMTSNVDQTGENIVDGTSSSDSVGYIRVKLKDVYNATLPATGTVQVSATGDVTVGVSTAATTDTAVTSASASAKTWIASGTGADLSIAVAQLSGAPTTAVVSISYDGTVMFTKTITFLGKPAKVVVSDVTVGERKTAANGKGYFRYTVTDAAGNPLGGRVAVADSTFNAGAVAVVSTLAFGNDSNGYTDATTGKTPAVNATEISEDDVANYTCTNTGGPASLKIKVATDSTNTEYVTSDAFSVLCGGSADTWTISMDKATYAPGEIATLTVSAKDEKGLAVHSLDDLSTVEYSFGGMTFVTAPTSVDYFNSAAGSKTYKLSVGTTEGSFVGTFKISGTTDTSAKTVQYKVANPNATVSNADVLKSIVSLIASINKQIQALQKLILRR
jgi:hypothetical protein